MSGHSKWAQIKRQKGAADAKRGQLFTKLGREITIATRAGGADPEGNARLRLAVQRAREANMPAETIERAIKRGVGGGEAAALEEVVYEGYAPGGAALLVEVATDNRNRTAAEIRSVLGRAGGSLGESGCVAWNFDSRGVVSVELGRRDGEEAALVAIDAGAEDFRVEPGSIELYSTPAELERVRTALEQAGYTVASAEVTMLPRTTVQLAPSEAVAVLRLVERLEELDDVQQVYTSLEISDEVLNALAVK
ncbi:MAG: YebC/PmpR family DNA-binding transcriptional regulator [Chloroflexi bacterium]|nr:YebC/PmpR family DNA-binding transcriptional regulator [Chloroflexota bacterium]